MMESPQITARVAAGFYLLVFLTGGFALFSGGALVGSRDAAATAANILAHESSVRIGFAALLLSSACYVVVTALFYVLFKPVNKTLSLVAAFFSLVGCASGGGAAVFQLAPLAVLNIPDPLAPGDGRERSAMERAGKRMNRRIPCRTS